MNIPRIEIRQQYGQIGIDADLGRQEIEQPGPTLEMRTIRPEVEIQQSIGTLQINQDRAWDALAIGSHLQTMSQIYSLTTEMAIRGLARRVEEGNRLAEIHKGGNPIAEMALDWQRRFPEYNFAGPASYDNVDVNYIPGDLSIHASRGSVEYHINVNAPVHRYERGAIDIYMQQHPKVDIIAPQIDAAV